MGWARGLVALAATGILAGGAGYAVAAAVGSQAETHGTPAPMQGANPQVPRDSPIALDTDPGYPALAPGLPLRAQHFGSPNYGFTIDVPTGWIRYPTDIPDEWNLRPPDGVRNGYVVRIKVITSQRRTVAQAIDSRLTDLGGASAVGRFHVSARLPNGFDATYIDLSNGGAFLRYSFERFATVPPLDYAQVQVAGTGRAVDSEALRELIDQITLSVTR